MRTQLLVLGALCHAGTGVTPGKARAMTSAMASRSMLVSVLRHPRVVRALREQPGREACLPCRSHGRFVENWPRMTASRAALCLSVRTIEPEPATARTCETSSVP